MYYVSVFCASQMPSLLEPELGLSGLFLVFSAVSGVFFGMVLMFVPETKGKTFEEHVADVINQS